MADAPLTFVALMNSVFWLLKEKPVVIYLDNITFFIKSKAQQKLGLKDVLIILCDNQLYAKPS